MLKTPEQYETAFVLERVSEYPAIDRLEERMGYKLDRNRLEFAARVLACPVKKNPPNWQHGRVIYAVLRKYMEDSGDSLFFLDIGTAKGFSALCMRWAALDAGKTARIVSLDLLDPAERMPRNTVAEMTGTKLLAEILQDWPETKDIEFVCSGASRWLAANIHRVNFAFVDGSHKYESVAEEISHLREVQDLGDMAVFDDLHIPGIRRAVREAQGYEVDTIQILPKRAYGIGVRV